MFIESSGLGAEGDTNEHYLVLALKKSRTVLEQIFSNISIRKAMIEARKAIEETRKFTGKRNHVWWW